MCIVIDTLASRYGIKGPPEGAGERVFECARKNQNLPEPRETARMDYNAYLENGKATLPAYVLAEYNQRETCRRE